MTTPLVTSSPNGTCDDNTRTAYGIFSLCASTLLICAWNAVHLDIPRDKTFWNNHGARAVWLAVALFFPELLVLSAIGEREEAAETAEVAKAYLVTAGELEPEFDETASRRRTPFDVVYSHLRASLTLPSALEMATASQVRRIWAARGVRSSDSESMHAMTRRTGVVFAPVPQRTETVTNDERQGVERRIHPWSITHGFYVSMGGIALVHETLSRPMTLKPEYVQYLMRTAPTRLPDLSADDIIDRSKVDPVAKALLCCQLLSFSVGCMARLATRLPLSLAEITTLSHCLCAMLAYALWWHKPHGIRQQTFILATPEEECGGWWSECDKEPVASSMLRTPEEKALLLVLLIVPPLYGIPHLLGFWQEFPSSWEHLAWKVATVAVLSSTLVFVVAMGPLVQAAKTAEEYLAQKSPLLSKCSSTLNWCLVRVGICGLVVYPLANAFLICESFRQLFALPEGSLRDISWSQYLPLFS